MSNRRSVLVCLFVVACAVVACGGPPRVEPLPMPPDIARPQAHAPVDSGSDHTGGEAQQAYYYSGGKKVFLSDTGVAVVKLKGAPGRHSDFSFQKATLAANSPLSELAATLERSGMVFVNTRGPGALDLQKARDTHPDDVDYIMPVVEVLTGPKGERNGTPSTMIMTPRIAVRFANAVSEREVASYAEGSGLRIVTKQEHVPNGYILELAEGSPTYPRVLSASNQLYEKGLGGQRLLYAHPDFVPTKRKLNTLFPSDPLFPKQWHLENTGQGSGKPLADVRARDAWSMTTGDPSIVIAIIDDSVEKDHPDLKDNFKVGRYYNGLLGTSDNDPSPRDGTQRHGTSCAGVAVATSNSVGGCGVAPDCSLIGVNFWDASVAQTAEAFYFCDQNDAAVISCSWSWGDAFDAVSVAIKDLFANGRGGKGAVILFASGNDSGAISTHQIFGTLKEVICIGATNWRDDHAPYSNSGPQLSVVAPSGDRWWIRPEALGILTTDNTEQSPSNGSFSGYTLGNYTPNIGSEAFGGTSSATPLVAGVCGLILSVKPDLTATEVRDILESTADKIPGELRPANYDSSGHDEYYGYGRVNAKQALDAVTGTSGVDLVELPVIWANVLHAAIDVAGDEDTYSFQASQSGEYTIETEGSTDVVMSLFGPNSDTTLIDQDDDGGVGTNSKIEVSLGPGKYFVGVRHYSSSKTGAYDIKVVGKGSSPGPSNRMSRR